MSKAGFDGIATGPPARAPSSDEFPPARAPGDTIPFPLLSDSMAALEIDLDAITSDAVVSQPTGATDTTNAQETRQLSAVTVAAEVPFPLSPRHPESSPWPTSSNGSGDGNECSGTLGSEDPRVWQQLAGHGQVQCGQTPVACPPGLAFPAGANAVPPATAAPPCALRRHVLSHLDSAGAAGGPWPAALEGSPTSPQMRSLGPE
ncbi:hypothetical protein Daus18300_010771 [Diaporthe australafricana]|uniref:Uncharacterized protein n=1 Tax=Diaporthe australafricana TaxID=127596 RepID=A0ABR3W9F0_9PEZI